MQSGFVQETEVGWFVPFNPPETTAGGIRQNRNAPRRAGFDAEEHRLLAGSGDLHAASMRRRTQKAMTAIASRTSDTGSGITVRRTLSAVTWKLKSDAW